MLRSGIWYTYLQLGVPWNECCIVWAWHRICIGGRVVMQPLLLVLDVLPVGICVEETALL